MLISGLLPCDLPLMQLLLQKKQVRTIGGAKDLSDALAPFRQRCTLPDTELLVLVHLQHQWAQA